MPFLVFMINQNRYFFTSISYQQACTSSIVTIETLGIRCKICSGLVIKTPERLLWRHSGVFIVNFEDISDHFPVFFVDFEQVNISWVYYFKLK